MCHVASLSVTYIGLGFIQLNTMMSDGLCEGLGKSDGTFIMTLLMTSLTVLVFWILIRSLV